MPTLTEIDNEIKVTMEHLERLKNQRGDIVYGDAGDQKTDPSAPGAPGLASALGNPAGTQPGGPQEPRHGDSGLRPPSAAEASSYDKIKAGITAINRGN